MRRVSIYYAVTVAVIALDGTAYAQLPPPPNYPNIAANYICTDHCNPDGGLAKIGQDGGFLTLINEKSQGTSGYFESEHTIRARAGGGWSAMRATINGPEIHWENGTVWRHQ
jgi:hypothetical protein